MSVLASTCFKASGRRHRLMLRGLERWWVHLRWEELMLLLLELRFHLNLLLKAVGQWESSCDMLLRRVLVRLLRLWLAVRFLDSGRYLRPLPLISPLISYRTWDY